MLWKPTDAIAAFSMVEALSPNNTVVSEQYEATTLSNHCHEHNDLHLTSSELEMSSVVTGIVVVVVVDVAIRGGGAGPHWASRRQEKYN